MKKTAARQVRHALERIGIELTFGIPGDHNIELYDGNHTFLTDELMPVQEGGVLCEAAVLEERAPARDVPSGCHMPSGYDTKWRRP